MGKHRTKLTNDEILLIMDYLSKGFTEAKWKKNPKRAEATYETYQTIGQAMGESHIVLEYFVNYPATPKAPKTKDGK